LSSERNYYDVLGVHPEASALEIESAYRRLAKQYDPRRSGDASTSQKMIEVNAAYEFLSDPINRDLYNWSLDGLGKHGKDEQWLERRAWDVRRTALEMASKRKPRQQIVDAVIRWGVSIDRASRIADYEIEFASRSRKKESRYLIGFGLLVFIVGCVLVCHDVFQRGWEGWRTDAFPEVIAIIGLFILISGLVQRFTH